MRLFSPRTSDYCYVEEKSNTSAVIFSARIPIEDYLTSTSLEWAIRNTLIDALLGKYEIANFRLGFLPA